MGLGVDLGGVGVGMGVKTGEKMGVGEDEDV